MVTQEFLHNKYNYDKVTGLFTSKKGKLVGGLNHNGYIKIGMTINDVKHQFLAHRLAWLYVHGKFPSKDLDHIDHNRVNNCIHNLREVSNSENMRNQLLHSNNKSGYMGLTGRRMTTDGLLGFS